jgi:hypothetical protein
MDNFPDILGNGSTVGTGVGVVMPVEALGAFHHVFARAIDEAVLAEIVVPTLA